MEQNANQTVTPAESTKYCKHCGAKIPVDAVICTVCGRQVETLHSTPTQPNIVINNSNQNVNQNIARSYAGKRKNKWVALLLCIFLGVLGAHKFYEGKIGMGILYLLTGGLFAIGIIVDFFALLVKPNPYFV